MREVFIEHFDFFNWINRLDKQDLLYALVKFFADKDLHPEAVSTLEMGYLFENLIRKFNEASNATAGDHFTPREVIRLMTSLLFAKDGDKLAAEASVIDILDPACGTGGMLATANDYLRQSNANLRVNLFGQEINPESFGICRSDMLITGHSPDNIRLGNTLTRDRFPEKTFTYALSNPPYGVDYSEEYDAVKPGRLNGPYDNAMMASFMKTLKVEGVYPMAFESEEDVSRHLPRFIDSYNERRLHSALGYMSPNRFEEKQSRKPVKSAA